MNSNFLVEKKWISEALTQGFAFPFTKVSLNVNCHKFSLIFWPNEDKSTQFSSETLSEDLFGKDFVMQLEDQTPAKT